MNDERRKRRQCIGYPYIPGESACANLTNRNPYWCDECDQKRLDVITKTLKEMAENMRRTGDPAGERVR